MTPNDLLRLPGGDAGFELVDGDIRQQNRSKESSRIAGRVYFFLEHFSRSHVPAWVFPPGAGFHCFEDRVNHVRKPAVSFVPLARMTVADYEAEGFIKIAPDLAVEVISPNDNAEEVESKIEDWLAAGVKVVWEVYPSRQVVRAHRPDGTITLFRAADTPAAEDVLPGFACPVAALFRLPGETAPPA